MCFVYISQHAENFVLYNKEMERQGEGDEQGEALHLLCRGGGGSDKFTVLNIQRQCPLVLLLKVG